MIVKNVFFKPIYTKWTLLPSDRSISYIRGVWLVFIVIMFFLGISELNANNEDPDRTPYSSASNLGLDCLPVSLLWEARLKWVKFIEFLLDQANFYLICPAVLQILCRLDLHFSSISEKQQQNVSKCCLLQLCTAL